MIKSAHTFLIWQVGDIGIMGGPARLDGKAVEGVRIFLGGKIGEGAALAEEFDKGVPAADEYLVPKLRDILVEHFGATPKDKDEGLKERPGAWWREE